MKLPTQLLTMDPIARDRALSVCAVQGQDYDAAHTLDQPIDGLPFETAKGCVCGKMIMTRAAFGAAPAALRADLDALYHLGLVYLIDVTTTTGTEPLVQGVWVRPVEEAG